ncbi:hypothetical protein SBA4_4230004 [Candidatus Sulfopaludibacter sp. SbA4]|nr:hypothetical protein SBA4_4230004 [Candidatus Sulfopaludibacter sp. SbA4]
MGSAVSRNVYYTSAEMPFRKIDPGGPAYGTLSPGCALRAAEPDAKSGFVMVAMLALGIGQAAQII